MALDPLDRYRERIAAGRSIPHFDPRDGGTMARCLILLETPGAGMTAAHTVSRDNPTGTSRNLTRFAGAAGLERRDTLIWNVVPWVVHAPGARNRPVRRSEIAEGIALLPGLLDLLPKLRVVILSGRPATSAEPAVRRHRPGLAILTMPHPSPTIVCTSPAIGERIAATLAEAAGLVRANG